MQAYELLAKLHNLTLCGQDDEGQLEWIGTREQWEKAEDEERILLDTI
jgi:hypothetical protein